MNYNRRTFIRAFLVAVALIAQTAVGQVAGHARSAAAYHPNDVLDPATLMSQGNFTNSAKRGYVVVEGFIDYVAGSISDASNTTRVGTEADGDFHFEMQSTKALRPGGESPNGLVCEIDPAWQLSGWNVLSQINRKNPTTYRKVRVYGWLRFGTESGHSGTQAYQLGNGKTFMGHWEIHPVEKIEAIDGRGSFAIGAAARVTSWPIAQRYKVTNANFAKPGPSNYATLIGTVQRIAASPDQSGDIDVSVRAGANTYLATIPQYYITSFNSSTQKVALAHVPNFSAINYSLQPDSATRTFYGLRDWKFGQTGPFAALQPVEMIK